MYFEVVRSQRDEYLSTVRSLIKKRSSTSHNTRVSGELVVMSDTTNLLLTFAGLNGALACLTLWKISREESKKGRKLAWNFSFQKPLK